MNKVILVGRLGKDAETRYTPGGTAVTNFSLATNRRVKNQQTGNYENGADWHDIVLWKGENVAQFLTKGSQVGVEGRLQTRKFEGSDGQTKYCTEVHCDNFGIELLGGKQDGDQQRSKPTPQQQPMDAGDDDVPF